MPYIEQHYRDEFEDIFTQSCGYPLNPGELNYVITRLITMYLEDTRVSYEHLNEVIGALECAKLELYRRMVAPYEDQKKDQNGDVY